MVNDRILKALCWLEVLLVLAKLGRRSLGFLSYVFCMYRLCMK